MENCVLTEEGRKDIVIFLSMCGEKDRDFLSLKPEERNIEDYVRLIIAASVFGCYAAVFRVLSEATECGVDNEVVECLQRTNSDYGKIIGWLDEFVEGIRNNDIKNIVSEHYARIRALAEKENFALNKWCAKFSGEA